MTADSSHSDSSAGPRRTWTLPLGEPIVGLNVTVAYSGRGRGWEAVWYGRGGGCCWTPWGALWGAWRHHRSPQPLLPQKPGQVAP